MGEASTVLQYLLKCRCCSATTRIDVAESRRALNKHLADETSTGLCTAGGNDHGTAQQ
jgi:hypothetical protein